jgi:DNA polymerase elongation subunit (family B)
MRVLTLDIECSPNLGYVWSLWKQNVSIGQLEEVGEVISFAAKWHGSKKVLFYSVYHDGKEAMLKAAHDLLSEADVVVGYNSKSFDMKHLNREFVLAGMEPPAPYAQVDLLLVVKKNFRFTSNKLDFVAQQLNIGAKTSHTGFQLWKDCMENKKPAWDLMRTYNKQDVVITEKLYDRLLPWIQGHPSMGLYEDLEGVCPNCGSDDLLKQGLAYTAISTFQRFKCASCGKWSRSSKRAGGTEMRGL